MTTRTKEEWTNFVHECITQEDCEAKLVEEFVKMQDELKDENYIREFYAKKYCNAKNAINMINDASNFARSNV